MSSNLQKDLSNLIEDGIITEDIAERIRLYYEKDKIDQSNILKNIITVIGAFLVGAGILLILAHNWDELPKYIKTVLAFVPLIISQILTVYILLKEQGNKIWQESVGVFIYISVAISISLVSQIYHINGDFSSFILTWMLLVLPMVYILDSSMVSLLYLGGIAIFSVNSSVEYIGIFPKSFLYFPLLILVLPHYYKLLTKFKNNNYTYFHNWIVPLSSVMSFSMMLQYSFYFTPIVYLSLFAIIYLFGKSKVLQYSSIINNAYLIIGLIGTVVFLFFVSFDDYWMDLSSKNLFDSPLSNFVLIGFLIFIAGLLLLNRIVKSRYSFDPFDWAFLLVSILIILNISIELADVIPMILINVFLLFSGVYYIWRGEKNNDLIQLNIGLLIISILIIVRFFDYDISFLVRGLVFILIGIGFFVGNYLLMKKRDLQEKS